MKKFFALILSPSISLGFLVFEQYLFPQNAVMARFIVVALMMFVWWITEIVPLWVTALLPVILFPVFGIMKGETAASFYFNDIAMLLLGGFLLAIAVEKSGLHKRIAALILSNFGGGSRKILFGLMSANALLSAWIANTTGTVMMIPVALAALRGFSENLPKTQQENLAKGLLLGIAYSSSIGGVSTLVGTPPNLIFHKIYHQIFPQLPQVTFLNWLVIGLPISIVMLVIAWRVLIYMFDFPSEKGLKTWQKSPKQPIKWDEGWVICIFSITIILWMFRADLNLGFIVVPGISSLFTRPDFLDDGVVAVGMAAILFFIPSKAGTQKTLLDHQAIKEIPWDVMLLFGGGFALAGGFISTGFAEWISQYLARFAHLSLYFMIPVISTLSTFLSEIASNTAMAQLMMPVLAQLAIQTSLSPLLLMVSSTISNSFSFMMPTSTPPNAIVFATGRVPIRDMIRVGLILNIIGVIVVSLYMLVIQYFF